MGAVAQRAVLSGSGRTMTRGNWSPGIKTSMATQTYAFAPAWSALGFEHKKHWLSTDYRREVVKSAYLLQTAPSVRGGRLQTF
jgi:hypothetical protein